MTKVKKIKEEAVVPETPAGEAEAQVEEKQDGVPEAVKGEVATVLPTVLDATGKFYKKALSDGAFILVNPAGQRVSKPMKEAEIESLVLKMSR